MAKRRTRRRARKSSSKRRRERSLPKKLQVEMEYVIELLDRRQWSEAQDLLVSLNKRFPRRVEILSALLEVSYELNEMTSYQSYCEQLVQISPDPDFLLMLGSVYLKNMLPALALETFHKFVARYPNHEEIQSARKTVAKLEGNIDEILAEIGYPEGNNFE